MIGYEAFGEAGRWLVLVLSLLELWCGVVWMNIVSWNNCTLMLAGYPLHWLIFGFLLLASATCWMRTLQKAGRMSILAALALCVAVGSVVAQLRLLPRLSKEHDREYSPARWEGVGISAAIVAAAFTGHVALPSFYCAMERPGLLRRALTWAYVLLAIAYATVGAVGYTLYGVHSQELLLMDMGPSGGQRVSHSTRVLLNIMLAALTMKALCAVPVELLVMADVLQRELQSLRGIRLSERQSLQLRMLLWLPAAALSLGSFETVHHVIIFTGCVALLTSGLLPAALHLRLLWEQLSGLRRTLVVFEGAAALGLAVLIVLCLPAVGILPSLDTVGMPHRTAGASASLSSTTMLSNIVSSEVGQRVLGPT
jgi:amino acid permease